MPLESKIEHPFNDDDRSLLGIEKLSALETQKDQSKVVNGIAWLRLAKWSALISALSLFIPWESTYLPLPSVEKSIVHYLHEKFHPLAWSQFSLTTSAPNASRTQHTIYPAVMTDMLAVIPYTFQPLPLGSIQPLGWVNDQLSLMSDGLAGNEYHFYHVVHDSPWLDGESEYSILNEGLPYWFNGLVPLAYGLNDTGLMLQVNDACDYIISHQQNDSWLGPEAPGDRDLWGRFPFFLGLIQLLEAEPSKATEVIPAMYSFINLMHSMLVDNTGFTEIWGQVRYPDMLISLQWLYENYPGNNTQLLFDTMYLLNERGLDWSNYWTEENFIFVDLDTVQPPITADSPQFPFTHGVNAVQGLKAGAAIYRFTGNETLLQNNRNGVNWTFSYHGDPAGSLIGDERESSMAANRGSELCTAVETMYSLSYLYETLGDMDFADRCELAAFNALPVSITSNHWGRQYLALASEPFAGQLTSPNPFWNVGDFGIIYGLGMLSLPQYYLEGCIDGEYRTKLPLLHGQHAPRTSQIPLRLLRQSWRRWNRSLPSRPGSSIDQYFIQHPSSHHLRHQLPFQPPSQLQRDLFRALHPLPSSPLLVRSRVLLRQHQRQRHREFIVSGPSHWHDFHCTSCRQQHCDLLPRRNHTSSTTSKLNRSHLPRSSPLRPRRRPNHRHPPPRSVQRDLRRQLYQRRQISL